MKPRFIIPDLKFARETMGETLSLVDRRQDFQVNFFPANFKGQPGNKFVSYRGGRFLEQVEAESFNAALADATARYGLPDNLYPKTVYSSYYNVANTPIEKFPLYALKDRLLPDASRVIYDAETEAFILPGADDDSSIVLGRIEDFGAVFGSDEVNVAELFNKRQLSKITVDINDALKKYDKESSEFKAAMIKTAEELSREIAHYDPENIPFQKTLPPPVGLSVSDVLLKGYGGVINLQEALLGEAFPTKFRESADVIIKEVDDLSYEKSDLEAPYIEERRSLSPEQAENFLEGDDIYDGVYDDLVETDREDGHHDEIVGILYRDAIERTFGDTFSKRFGTGEESVKRAMYSFGELMELGVYVPASEGIGKGGYFDDVKEDILDRFYGIAQRAYPARIDPDYDLHEKFQMAIDISPVPRSEYDGPAEEDTYAGVMYYTSKRFSPSLLPIEKDSDGNQVIMPANYSDTAKNVMKILSIDPDTFTVWYNNTRDGANDPSEARSKMVTEEKTQHYRVSARVGTEEESKPVGPIEFDAEKISPEIIYEQFRPFFEEGKNHLSFITLEQEMNITHIYTDLPEEEWVEEEYTRFQPIVYEGFIDELLRSDIMGQIEENSVAGASTNTVINTEDYERFYKSFVQESENISGGFHAVTALSYMDVEDARKINESENGKLKIPYGTFIGFYDGVSGSGSVMGIDLPEKGIEIDLSEYRATVSVATEKRDGLYAIDDVYGFTGEVFLAGEEITFDAPPVKEQLEGMVQEWEKAQTKTPPPPSPRP